MARSPTVDRNGVRGAASAPAKPRIEPTAQQARAERLLDGIHGAGTDRQLQVRVRAAARAIEVERERSGSSGPGPIEAALLEQLAALPAERRERLRHKLLAATNSHGRLLRDVFDRGLRARGVALAPLGTMPAAQDSFAGVTSAARRELRGTTAEQRLARLHEAAAAPQRRQLPEIERSLAEGQAHFAAQGLRLDVATAAVNPQLEPVQFNQTLAQIASAAFGRKPAELTPRHYELLARANPHLDLLDRDPDEVAILAGERISIATTPRGNELQRLALAVMEGKLATSAPPAGLDRGAVAEAMALLREANESQAVTIDGSTRLASVEGRATALADKGHVRGVHAAFGRLIDELQAQSKDAAQRGPAALQGLRATILQAQLTYAEQLGRAAATTGPQAHAEARQVLGAAIAWHQAQKPASAQSIDLLRARLARSFEAEAEQRVQQFTVTAGEGRAGGKGAAQRVQTAVDELMGAAREAHRGRAGQSAEAKAASARQVARLDERGKLLRVQLHTAGGGHEAAMRELLPAAMAKQLAPTLVPSSDSAKRISTEGEELGAFTALFAEDREVRFLGDAQVAVAAEAVLGAPQGRDAAVTSLLELGQAYAEAKDVHQLNAVRQVLLEIDRRAGARKQALDPTLRARLGFIEARYAAEVGHPAGAAQLYGRAAELARSGGDRELAGKAALAQASMLNTAAVAGADRTAQQSAARQLGELRKRLEKDAAPLSREQLARLTLMEANAFVAARDPKAAEAAIEHLDAYKDLDWARAAVDTFYADNSKDALTAAIRVGLREANGLSIGEEMGGALAGAFAGAGLGAAVGAGAGGVGALPGAGLGFLVGLGTGFLGTKAYGVAQGWDEIMDAYDTGLTNLSAGDAWTDAAFVGLDVVGAFMPLGGLRRVGTAGVKTLLGASDTELAGAVASKIEAAIAKTGKAVSQQELHRITQAVIMKELTEGTLDFGGAKMATAGISAAAVPLGIQYLQLRQMPEGAEKEAALRRFAEGLRSAGALLATMGGASAVAGKMALRGAKPWQQVAVDLDFKAIKNATRGPLSDAQSAAVERARAQLNGGFAGRLQGRGILTDGITGVSAKYSETISELLGRPLSSVDPAGAANVDHVTSVMEDAMARAAARKGAPLNQAEVDEIALTTVLTDVLGKGRSPAELLDMPTAPLLDARTGRSIGGSGRDFWVHAIAKQLETWPTADAPPAGAQREALLAAIGKYATPNPDQVREVALARGVTKADADALAAKWAAALPEMGKKFGQYWSVMPFMAGTALHGVPAFGHVASAVRRVDSSPEAAQRVYAAVLGHHMAGFVAAAWHKAGVKPDFAAMAAAGQLRPADAPKLARLYDEAIELAGKWRGKANGAATGDKPSLSRAEYRAYERDAGGLRGAIRALQDDPALAAVADQLISDDAGQFTAVGMPKWIGMYHALPFPPTPTNGALLDAIVKGAVEPYHLENLTRGSGDGVHAAWDVAMRSIGRVLVTDDPNFAPHYRQAQGTQELRPFAELITSDAPTRDAYLAARGLAELPAELPVQDLVTWFREQPTDTAALNRMMGVLEQNTARAAR